ncbi:MAG TPA: hypothetical protein VII11_04725 [Bacteroidota bacterium]
MKSFKYALLFGFLIWLIPFAVAVVIFPLRENDRPLFESIMPVAVTIAAVIFSVLYYRKVESGFVREGILLGIVWYLISVGIDLLMFSWGPMAMTFIDYMKDIGLTYLIIPTVTIGFGVLRQGKMPGKAA